MKKIFVIIGLVLVFFFGNTLSTLAVNSGDGKEIISVTNNFLLSLSTGDTEGAIAQLSPDMNLETKEKIRKNLSGVVKINITDIVSENVGKDWSDNRWKVSGIYSAKGTGWNKSGFSTYFIYEKQNGEWKIIDTDIYNAGEVGIWLFIFLGIIIPLISFRIWMLVNCAKKANQVGKIKWLIIVLVLPLGDVFYFFMGRKSLKDSLPINKDPL